MLSNEISNTELDTQGIIIYGKQGAGKTIMGILLAMENWSNRIYSNISIFHKEKLINKKLRSAKDVYKIGFSKTPGVIIIDEAGINANSKDTRNKDNRLLQEILFLVRKKNCSLIWIAQRYESIDINARVLADLILEMKKIRRSNKHPMFIGSRKVIQGTKQFTKNSYTIDGIQLLKKWNITYNTLESSKFSS